MKKTTRLTILGLMLSPIAILGSATSSAQTATPTPVQNISPAPATSPSRTATAANPPKVTGIEGHLELDSIIKVEVANFSEWAATHDATKLVPFLNGRAVRGGY